MWVFRREPRLQVEPLAQDSGGTGGAALRVAGRLCLALTGGAATGTPVTGFSLEGPRYAQILCAQRFGSSQRPS